MTIILGRVIFDARKKKKLTQQHIADTLGVTRAAVGQWESGANEPSAQNLVSLAQLLDIDISRDTGGLVQPDGTSNPSLDEIRKLYPTVKFDLGDEVPVLGFIMERGNKEEYYVSRGTMTIDRPLGLKQEPHVYSILLLTDSMQPRYDHGDYIYVSPDQIVKEGDYVVVELTPPEEHDEREVLVRRFLKDDGEALTFHRFNPNAQNSYPKSKVLSMHKVLRWMSVIQK